MGGRDRNTTLTLILSALFVWLNSLFSSDLHWVLFLKVNIDEQQSLGLKRGQWGKKGVDGRSTKL